MLRSVVDIPVVERVGVRYLNRIVDQDVMVRLDELVKPEVLGYQALVPADATEVGLVQAINQVEYNVGGGTLQVRSGVLAPGQTVDPSVAPVSGPSWILDLDASAQVDSRFDIDDALERAGRLSDTAYDLFKFVIKNGFVEHFGRREE
ncbi:TIGR04255 family protein [Curtobacterium flaccumfaciens]|nr:TIGR04255 family protein [Curtobacterium flaccumfaciens]